MQPTLLEVSHKVTLISPRLNWHRSSFGVLIFRRQDCHGFGFYGRYFTLANPRCTKPGCPFNSASNHGPCSATGGILSYYEIMDILNGATSKKRATTITPTHDATDAVTYFTFDENQWASYDVKLISRQPGRDVRVNRLICAGLALLLGLSLVLLTPDLGLQ